MKERQLIIRVKDKNNGWLSTGGEFVDNREDATKFTSIVTAVKRAFSSGLTEETFEEDWDLEEVEDE